MSLHVMCLPHTKQSLQQFKAVPVKGTHSALDLPHGGWKPDMPTDDLVWPAKLKSKTFYAKNTDIFTLISINHSIGLRSIFYNKHYFHYRSTQNSIRA